MNALLVCLNINQFHTLFSINSALDYNFLSEYVLKQMIIKCVLGQVAYI